MNCPNCSELVSGKFCQHCGQQTVVPRITWKFLFTELQSRLFGFDNRFMRTFRDLTIRPEKVINTVLEGVRVRYFSPLSYYFLLITIYVLLISFMDIDMTEYTRAFSFEEEGATTENQQEFQEVMNQWIFSNFRLFSFFMIPVFILGTFLVFYNKKYNFLETSVLVFYAMGNPIILSILMLTPYKLGIMTSASVILPLVSYAYFAWVCARFYPGNGVWNFVKGTLALLISLILLMFIALSGIFLYAVFDPAFRDTFQ